MRAGDVASRSAAITPEGEAQVRALQGGGQPLPGAVRSLFEPRFGASFGGVRIHTGAGAAKAARSVNARAYTLGNDVVFGAGEYAPETAAGRRLIAHELTHTLQHPGGAPARRLRRTISVKDEGQTTPPHTQNNGAVVASLFNQLCPDITWQLVSGAIQPKAATDCDPKAVQKTTTPTACDCACSFTKPGGPHVEIVINPTDDDTTSTGANSFRVRLTGQAATGIRGVKGAGPVSGSPLQQVPDPAFVILGHELCGHAKTTLSKNPASTAEVFHQMSPGWDKTAVDIENRIRQEHNVNRSADLGTRIGEFEDPDGDIHAGSIIALPAGTSLATFLGELGVPVEAKFPRCVRTDYFFPCTAIPAKEAEMKKLQVVARAMVADNGNQHFPWACRNDTSLGGKHFNIEGVFWHRASGADTKQTIEKQWGVAVAAIDRANKVFANGVDGIAPTQALTAGTMVVIPYKSGPGATRYFLTRGTGPC